MKSSGYYHSIFNKIVILVLILAMVFTFSSCGKKEEPEPEPEPEPVVTEPEPVVEPEPEPEPDPIINYLTGETGPKDKIIKRRPVAIVIENNPASRPQWGMDDKIYAPDIILEGEVEGGITRMLWMWADYKALPEYVGPVRSARPPYIMFSQLFDSIFVHWGRSGSGGNYVGADYYFRTHEIAHLDGMYYERTAPFDRKQGTGRAIEHTGIVYGDQLAETIKAKFRTKPKNENYTKFKFYDEKKARGKKNSCYELDLKFSGLAGHTVWTYNKKAKKYYSDSFQTNVSRDNLLVLFDDTEYVTKPGKATYCNYSFAGGNAYYASCGSYQKIKWRVKDGKIQLYKNVKVKNSDGTTSTKKKTVSLNPGKTWIGWASHNNNGKCSIKSKKELSN